MQSGSNDTWFVSPDTVLQVCYRGDVDRLVRVAELLAVLPDGVPGPAKCVAACRRPDLRWRRRGTVHPLYQEGGARDVR